MPRLTRGPAERELQRLIGLFLQAETDIINEIGRLRSLGLADYHAEAALERVQSILRKLETDCWTYVPRMIETQFYVTHPEARKPLEEPETPEKHLRAYQNARSLTGEQVDIAARLTMNLMGQITEADAFAAAALADALLGRAETDVFRRTGLEQTARMAAAGRGAYRALPGFVEALRREGVTAFVDRAGRRWSLHTYGSMVLRTTSRQAEIMAVLTADPDHDLYQISAHGTTCPLCAPLEGRVYSKSGTDPDFPPLAAAFGKMDPAGPNTLENSWLNIHPNCLHQLRRWTPMGRSAEEVQKIKDFSSFRKNPPSRDPRSEAQIAAYRQKERNRARYLRDYRQWERYRETLGEAAPKTFETFRRHKYAVTDPETGKRRGDGEFKGWAAAYRRENGLAHSTKSGIIDPKRPGEIPEVSKSSKFRRTLTPEDVTREYLDHAVPGQGSVTLEDGYRAKGHQDEIDMAEWLHRTFGGDIRLLKESDIKNQKRPDFLWNGKAWELKGTSSTIDRADKLLQHAIKQIQDDPGGVILNVLKELDMDALEEQLSRRVERSRISGLDLMLLSKGALTKVLRYKKEK